MIKMKAAIIAVKPITTPVEPISSCRFDQETFTSSAFTSPTNLIGLANKFIAFFNSFQPPLFTGAEGLEPPGQDLESRRLAN
jgi:hypothetical protein